MFFSKPLSEANGQTALALIEFKEDSEVSEAALQLLEEEAVMEDEALVTYLLLLCKGLQQEAFRASLQKLQLPKALQLDYQATLKGWSSQK